MYTGWKTMFLTYIYVVIAKDMGHGRSNDDEYKGIINIQVQYITLNQQKHFSACVVHIFFISKTPFKHIQPEITKT